MGIVSWIQTSEHIFPDSEQRALSAHHLKHSASRFDL